MADTRLSDPKSELAQAMLRQRAAIGVLGLSLPLALFFGHWTVLAISKRERFPEDWHYLSVSEYVHSPIGAVFVGAMFAVASFLFAYRGYKPKQDPKTKKTESFSDNLITSIAAVFALGVALFPVDRATPCPRSAVHWLHLGSAGLFFITLTVMCLRFTRESSDDAPPDLDGRRDVRVITYRVCGWTMLGLVAVMLIWSVATRGTWLEYTPAIFIGEWLALTAFGISWLAKGRFLQLLVHAEVPFSKRVDTIVMRTLGVVGPKEPASLPSDAPGR